MPVLESVVVANTEKISKNVKTVYRLATPPLNIMKG